MIQNERQYSITKKWIAKFRKAIGDFNIQEATKKIGSSVLAKAELFALNSELLTLIEQVKVYENQKIAARVKEGEVAAAKQMAARFRKYKYQKLDKRPKVIRILENIKKNLKSLKELKYAAEDEMYRFYHHSFKVYWLQDSTLKIVKKIKSFSRQPLDDWFLQIISEGTKKKWKRSHNDNWLKHTRPILEAFFHANYFLDMMIKYGKELKKPPSLLPSGWAAILTLYNLR
jgi:hypothetical protein